MVGKTFIQKMAVLELEDFDGILGNDFLQQFESVNIDYTKKAVKVTYQGEELDLKCPQMDVTSGKFFQRWIKRSKTPYYLATIQTNKENTNRSEMEFGKEVVERLRNEFPTVFAEDLPDKEPESGKHHIELKSDEIPKRRPVQWSPEQEAELSRQLGYLLKKGLIQKSTSPYSSAVLLAKKPDGTWRFCIDFWNLNKIVRRNAYPLPLIDQLLDKLVRAKYFTKIDLRNGIDEWD
jgi:hypothetical protein